MSRPVNQALENLIPRHSGALPPELIELASSLLTQSRSQISNLKPDEEIARTYACANIACERLKTTLNLPKIEPRPPCPPRVYSKLYSYFDKTLVSTATSRKRARQNEKKSEPDRKLPERGTPSKEKSFEGFRANRTPRQGLKYGGMKKDAKLPSWVGPSIRNVCKDMDTGKAIPHVLAGVETILFHSPPGGGQAQMEGNIPALVAAVWFYVTTRLEDEPTDTRTFKERRRKVSGILKGLKEDKAVLQKIGDSEESWQDWEVVTTEAVDSWLQEITARGWLQLEWYVNIEDGVGARGLARDDEDEEGEVEVEQDEEIKAQKRRKEWGKEIGRGTMKQDQTDYLSDEKRKAYAVWKESMLAIIKEQIAGGILHEDVEMTEI